MKIGVIISYCTYDFRTLSAVIEGVKPFSEKIVVSISTHFFDGEPENKSLIQDALESHKDVTFVEYEYGEKPHYGLSIPIRKEDSDWSHYWHSVSRYVPLLLFDSSFDWILFVDSDEVIDPISFLKFFQKVEEAEYTAIRFGTYFYFREACFRALSSHSNGPLMVRYPYLKSEEVLDVGERRNLMEKIPGKKLSFASLEGEFFVHHYSWVRPYEDLKRKVSCWGHREEKDWKRLLKEEFQAPFRGVDLLYRLTYEKCNPYFDPLEVKMPMTPVQVTQIPLKITPNEYIKRSVEKLLIE